MKKIFSFSVKIFISSAFGILAALFADSMVHYHFAFATAYLFSAFIAFVILEVSFKKIFGL